MNTQMVKLESINFKALVGMKDKIAINSRTSLQAKNNNGMLQAFLYI